MHIAHLPPCFKGLMQLRGEKKEVIVTDKYQHTPKPSGHKPAAETMALPLPGYSSPWLDGRTTTGEKGNEMLLESILGEWSCGWMCYGPRSARPRGLISWEGALRCPVNKALPERGAPPERRLSSQRDQELTRLVKTPFSPPSSHWGWGFRVSKPDSILPDLSRVALNQREINGHTQLPFVFGPTVFSP